MKYIIFDSPLAGPFPVIFPTSIDHSMIAKSVHSEYPEIKICSAGFVSFEKFSNGILLATCSGESVSLKCLSNPVFDEAIIQIMLKNNR